MSARWIDSQAPQAPGRGSLAPEDHPSATEPTADTPGAHAPAAGAPRWGAGAPALSLAWCGFAALAALVIGGCMGLAWFVATRGAA